MTPDREGKKWRTPTPAEGEEEANAQLEGVECEPPSKGREGKPPPKAEGGGEPPLKEEDVGTTPDPKPNTPTEPNHPTPDPANHPTIQKFKTHLKRFKRHARRLKGGVRPSGSRV